MSQIAQVFAHRGASATYRENTLEAFREAARLGADGVELDARRTAAGVVMVNHDLLAGDVPAWVPTLEEALDACAPMVVNVEVKNLPGEPDYEPDEVVATRVAELIAVRGDHASTVVSSFSLATINRVREVDRGVPTAWLTLPGYDQAAAVATIVDHGHDGFHPHHAAVTPELVELAHAHGLFVNAWTVDDPARITELAGWGVDGICTNVPDVALAVLRGSPA